jgi:hypothetical protein
MSARADTVNLFAHGAPVLVATLCPSSAPPPPPTRGEWGVSVVRSVAECLDILLTADATLHQLEVADNVRLTVTVSG